MVAHLPLLPAIRPEAIAAGAGECSVMQSPLLEEETICVA
jgi:hypothetical protein